MPRGRISALSLDFTRFEIVHAYRLPRHLRLSLGIWPLARLPLGETPAQTVTLRLQILLRCYGFSLDLLRVSKGRARKSRLYSLRLSKVRTFSLNCPGSVFSSAACISNILASRISR